ncbi:MAG: prepilin-type N-terminal cleavage/methylation domain-containing protein [Acidobacteriota bacterium]
MKQLVCCPIDILAHKQSLMKHTEWVLGRGFPMSGVFSAKRLKGACPQRESAVSHQNNKRYLGETTLKGFTLIEVIVVLAVIAVLAAILTPIIIKNIEDAKIARAKSDVESIGKAIVEYRNDIGFWPSKHRNGASNPWQAINVIASEDITKIAPPDDGSDYDWNRGQIRTMEQFLINNDSQIVEISPNPHGLPAWEGPYITKLELDPWEYAYVANVGWLPEGADYSTSSTRRVWVISSGPNMTIETKYTGEGSIGGDDIGFGIK